jgi:biopolymer transport protein TolR
MRRRIRDEQHTGELNIVPYLDVVVNLVMFMLLSMTGLVSLGVLNVSAPRIGGDAAAASAAENAPRLLLTVAVGRQGFSIAGAGGVASDAVRADGGRPQLIPLRDGQYDYAALSDEMKRIKERFPTETALILSADPDVVYDVLIRTMDACREATVTAADGRSERRPLFFDVSLSVAG